MQIIVLGSGSKGNATYIRTKNTTILIDAGLSYLQLKNRLSQKNIKLDKIDVILVTHEHTDHIKHLASIAKKTSAKVYINENSYDVANKKLSGSLTYMDVSFIDANNKYEIGDLYIVPLLLSHDSVNCYGYLIKEKGTGNKTYGYLTDTGYIPEAYLDIIKNLQVISIEANHDVKMLKESSRPWPLIQRILSKNGHLSNVEVMNYIKEFNFQYVKTIVFSHISEECNTEKKVYDELLKAFAGDIPCDIRFAKQNEVLDIIEVK